MQKVKSLFGAASSEFSYTGRMVLRALTERRCLGVLLYCGKGEVKLRKGVEAKRRQEELIEGLQTLLTGTWGPLASI